MEQEEPLGAGFFPGPGAGWLRQQLETAQVIWGTLQVAFYSQGDESIQTWVQILILSLVSFEIFLCLSFLAWKMTVIIPHGALSTEPDHVENSQ